MRSDDMHLSPASFWTPDYLPASAWLTHAPFAFWLVDALRPKRFVELGTHHGFSYFTVCQAVARLGADTSAFAVDTWRGDDHAGHYGEEVYAAAAAHNDRFRSFSTLVRSTFSAALDGFSDRTIDLLHIDGRHHYDDVRADYEGWRPKLADDAVVLFHDIEVRERDFGVWRFFGELAEAHPSFSFLHGHGLGVLCPGPAVPGPLRSLLGSGPDAVRATRQAYAALGAAVAERREIRSLRRGIEALHRPDVDLAPDAVEAAMPEVAGDLTLAHVRAVRAAEQDARDARDAEMAEARRAEAAARSAAEAEHEEAQASRAALDAALAEATAVSAAARARADDLDREVELLRRVLIGRTRAVERLERLEGRLAAVSGVKDDLRRLLVAALHGGDGAAGGAAEDMEALEVVRDSGLFDPAFYRMRHPDVVAEGTSPLAHFMSVGWKELRDPSSAFSTAFYLSQNPDIAEAGRNPLLHYIQAGHAEGRAARPPREPARPDVAPLRERDAQPADLATARALIETGLFDANHYLSAYPDVAEDGRHPVLHYLADGWPEGRNPSASFDTAFYLAENADVAASGMNPLLHYARVGAAEGRRALAEDRDREEGDGAARLADEVVETGLFDDAFYRAHYRDVAEGGVEPALHYATDGWRERRNPGPLFDTGFYLAQNADVAASGNNPLLHFAKAGLIEGRRPGSGLSGVASDARSSDADYARWIEAHDSIDDDDRRAIRARIERFTYRPLISVVMPVYNTDLALLREAVGSVQAQLYTHWELCIADDASPDPRVAEALRAMAEADPRIKLVVRDENGNISAASNSAMALASGEFVALMDHDDLLAEHALFTVVAHLDDDPDYDLIYSDEDGIDGDGVRYQPYFKTDYNPELIVGHNFISHLGVYRRSVVEALGGFRLGFEGSQDYDLALRVVDAIDPKRILHVPRILYHWRHTAAEGSFSQRYLDRCAAAARAALVEHLERTAQEGELVSHPLRAEWHRILRRRPDPAPLVSIIVPTKDKVEVLRPCCDGILHRTDYPNIELIVVDHQSTDPDTVAYLSRLAGDRRVTVMPYEGAFNYSAINNAAVRRARGEVLAFLNNDIEVIGGDWLDEMVALAVRPEVGAVGAKLLYPDDRVQHGGVLLGVGGVAGHSHHLLSRENPGYMGLAALTMAVSAVTGACLVLRRATFEAVGGFDERDLRVAFNDVDLCLKVRQAGYRNVLAAQAVLYHHESLSRGFEDTPEKAARFGREVAFMREKWGEVLDADPFYNPNFDLVSADFRLSHPPRHGRPWSTHR